jgi:DNA-binding transcriptional LysR family regulator
VNLRHLEVFCAVVDCESFSGAAERLIMTQPAVSMQVQVVERYFGVQLLERRRRRVVLTEAGGLVHDWAIAVLSSELETRRRVDQLKHVETGRVVVGSSVTIGSYLLPPILSRFKRQHPEAEVVVRLGDRDEICSDVLSGNIDCGVLIAREIPPGLEVDVVGTEELVFVCAPSHRFASREIVPIAELANEPFIMAPKGSSYRKVIDDLLEDHGLHHVTIHMELDGAEGLMRGVQQGLGIGLGLRSGVEWELEQGAISEVHVDATPLLVDMGLVYHGRQRESGTLQEFRQYLREQLREHFQRWEAADFAAPVNGHAPQNGTNGNRTNERDPSEGQPAKPARRTAGRSADH